MRRTSATTLAQHDHHHQQQSTAKARTSVIIVAFLSGSLQYYYYCNHYCINISIALLFFHCGPKRMSGISISFLYCWYHYTNSHFVCIIATASLVSKFKTVISFAPLRSHRSIGLSSRGHFVHFFWAPPGSHRSIGFSTFGKTHRQVYFLEIDMATWPKGPQKLKFEHAICILKLKILECGSFWPVWADYWRFWVASGPTSSRASHQDGVSMPRKLLQINCIYDC